MPTEIEDMLVRELHEVAGGVAVPPMPALRPDEAGRRGSRLWQPLLVAAAVALLVGAAVLLGQRGADDAPEPAPSPSPSVSEIAVDAPTVPYLLDGRLYVDGRAIPGEWWGLQARGQVWLAAQSDGSWWWGGPGVESQRIDAQIDQGPAISPSGGYIAFIDLSSGRARLTGFDTQPAGEGFGEARIDLPASEDGVALRVAAVTDDGDVIVMGTRTRLMWRALFEDQRTVVDLTRTAPDQHVLQGTPAGLVVVDETDGPTDAATSEPYLATISGGGRLTEVATLPTYDALEVNPSGSWFLRSPAGTLGGEVTAVATLTAQAVGGSDEVVVAAPDGWALVTGGWTWEDDESFVAALVAAGDETDVRLVRCSATRGGCRVLADPSLR